MSDMRIVAGTAGTPGTPEEPPKKNALKIKSSLPHSEALE